MSNNTLSIASQTRPLTGTPRVPAVLENGLLYQSKSRCQKWGWKMVHQSSALPEREPAGQQIIPESGPSFGPEKQTPEIECLNKSKNGHANKDAPSANPPARQRTIDPSPLPSLWAWQHLSSRLGKAPQRPRQRHRNVFTRFRAAGSETVLQGRGRTAAGPKKRLSSNCCYIVLVIWSARTYRQLPQEHDRRIPGAIGQSINHQKDSCHGFCQGPRAARTTVPEPSAFLCADGFDLHARLTHSCAQFIQGAAQHGWRLVR